MKLITLSEKILKFMVKEFASKDKDIFFFDEIKDKFPDCSDSCLNKAIYFLQYDHFVYISPADDVAFRIELSPEGIRSCEENTLIKKGYSLLKEIKTLLP